MEPRTPESALPKQITKLSGNTIESVALKHEITLSGEDVGVGIWSDLVQATQTDLRERFSSTIRNKRTNQVEIMPIITGETDNGKEVPHLMPYPLPFLKARFSDRLTDIHTHPLNESVGHIKTTWPADGDILPLTIPNWRGARIILDRGGAHLIIKTGESRHRDEPPPPNLIENLFKEIAQKNGTSTEIQSRINGLLNEYGLSYFYKEGLTPDGDGAVSFKKP